MDRVFVYINRKVFGSMNFTFRVFPAHGLRARGLWLLYLFLKLRYLDTYLEILLAAVKFRVQISSDHGVPWDITYWDSSRPTLSGGVDALLGVFIFSYLDGLLCFKDV